MKNSCKRSQSTFIRSGLFQLEDSRKEIIYRQLGRCRTYSISKIVDSIRGFICKRSFVRTSHRLSKSKRVDIRTSKACHACQVCHLVHKSQTSNSDVYVTICKVLYGCCVAFVRWCFEKVITV